MFNPSNILNESAGYGSVSYLPECTIESLMEDTSIKAPEHLVESTCELLALHERNEAIIDSITGNHAIRSLHESGEVLLEGTRIDSIIEAAKKFIHGIWNKIQELFKSAAIHFSKLTKNGKDFYKAYEKDITQVLNTKGSLLHKKEIEWYDYKFYKGNGEMKTIFERIAGACSAETTATTMHISGTKFEDFEAAVTWFKDHYKVKDTKGYKEGNEAGQPEDADEVIKALSTDAITDMMDKIRGEVVAKISGGTASSVTSGEFNKELAEALQGSDSKETVELDVAAEKVKGSYILESNKVKKVLNDAIKATKKSLDDAIKALERYKKVANSNSGKSDLGDDAKINGKLAGLLDKYIKILEGSRSILLQANAKSLEVAKAAENQAKSIFVKVLSYRNKKDLDESTFDDSFGFGIRY